MDSWRKRVVLCAAVLIGINLAFVRYGGSDNDDFHAAGPFHSGNDDSSLLTHLIHAKSKREFDRPRVIACTLVRDKVNAVQSWVAFHLLQGFDEFMIYDDGSEPPLTASDFGSLAEFVIVKRWHNYSATTVPVTESHQHITRQWRAYHDCLDSHIGHNAFVATFDVDEYFWPCNLNPRIGDTMRELNALEIQMVTCPRFGGASAAYNDSVPIIAQLLHRAPAMQGEPISAVKKSFPDCTLLKSRDEPKGLCFGSTERKSVFDMKRYTKETHKWLTIHGLRNKSGLPPTPPAVDGTTSRTTGLCCNHYFVRDDAEAEWKARANRNDFYEKYLASDGVQNFYRWKKDTILHDHFSLPVAALLQEAGLPFASP